MHLRIKHRLFLAFLLATGIVVISLYLISKFSFERSLLRYVNRVEQERLTRLVSLLEDAYAEHGSWKFLRGDRRLWLHMVAASRHESASPIVPDLFRLPLPPRNRPFPEQGPPPAPPPKPNGPGPMDPHFEWRISLLNAERQTIFAGTARADKALIRPVTVASRTVGYLRLIPPRIIIDIQQKRFAAEQHRSMAAISLLVAGSAALLAFPLSKRMVKRITTLADATHKLTKGKYDVRITTKAGDELGQLARDFNSLAQTLEQAEQLRRRWVADISHELRTPLAILRGEIEAVQDGVRLLSPRILDTLHGEVMRLEHLVGDLYQLSLSDINALRFCKQDIDLAQVLRQTLDVHRPQFKEQGLALHAELPSKLPFYGDYERLGQLFSNLLKNTLRYTDRGGQLQIDMSTHGNEIQINFRDSEPGVPEEALRRLFDRLYRVETSRNRAHGGAGLGLALCKNIVEAHNGTIEARPSPLDGLWIAVILPKNG